MADGPAGKPDLGPHCTVPPEGWWCSREAGHDGPCAARPVAVGYRPAPFVSAGPKGAHHARCWPCMTGHHYPRPTPHGWAGADDLEHAAATHQPDPSDEACACPCTEDDAFCSSHLAELDEASWADDRLSLDGQPCPDCGSDGACAYDAEGRPLIHALTAEEPS